MDSRDQTDEDFNLLAWVTFKAYQLRPASVASGSEDLSPSRSLGCSLTSTEPLGIPPSLPSVLRSLVSTLFRGEKLFCERHKSPRFRKRRLH